MLADSGVNTDIFGAHSTWAASTSKAHSSQVILFWLLQDGLKLRLLQNSITNPCHSNALLLPFCHLIKVIDCQFVICLPVNHICSIDPVKCFKVFNCHFQILYMYFHLLGFHYMISLQSSLCYL